MKNISLLPLLFLFLVFGCSSDDDNTIEENPLVAQEILNIAYGSDTQQTMDVYLPEGRNEESTKVIVLIHGGSWIAGSKEDMSFLIPTVQASFPDYAIVNINYRLANAENPAYPMQINDIEQMFTFLEESDYHISDDYALIGVSAGAHLSMLYSYKHDADHDVKAVVDIVGPADFTDPNYTSHPLYSQAALTLTGTATPTNEEITEVNPVSYITAQAPPTLSFYGGQDPLVPATQGGILQENLNNAGVYNEFNFYPDGGHADWNFEIMQEVFGKTILFLQENF